MRFFTLLSLVFASVPIFAAPASRQPPSRSSTPERFTPPGTPELHNEGDFVGVRPGAYEEKTVENNLKKISIHPGVVMGGPHPETGKIPVAMISKKLPHNPPQAPIENFHPDSSVYGKISLGPPKQVLPHDMKPWKDERTGLRQTPLTRGNFNKLQHSMAPHVNWKPPTPPPPPVKPAQPLRKGQHVNAHASGSRHPAPGGPRHYGPPGPRHPSAGGPPHRSGTTGPRYPAPGAPHSHVATGSRHPGPGGPPHRPGPSGSRHPAPGPPHNHVATGSRHPAPGSPHTHVATGSRHPAAGGPSHPHPQGVGRPRTPTSPGPHPQAKKDKGKRPAFTGSKPTGGHPHGKAPGTKRSLRSR